MVPGTLRLQWRVVVGGFRLIPDPRRRLHQHLTQLLLLMRVAQIVAPQARLRAERFVPHVPRPRVVHAAFFAVDERRQPQVLPHICPPAIEIEVVAHQRRPAVGAIKAHNVVVLILHPNAPHEAPFVALLYRIDVKDQAAHFAQELAAHILNLVVLAVESVHIKVDHLQEAARKEFHVEEAPPASEHFVLDSGVAVQRFQVHAFRQLGPPKKVFVAIRYRS